MTNKMRNLYRGASLMVVSVGLASCGSSNNNNTSAPPAPPVQTARQEDQFGLAFGTAFRADPNGEPFAVNDGDLIPVSLTTEPVPIVG